MNDEAARCWLLQEPQGLVLGDQNLYVEPGKSPVDRIVGKLLAAPGTFRGVGGVPPGRHGSTVDGGEGR